jgi:hypothetical protein
MYWEKIPEKVRLATLDRMYQNTAMSESPSKKRKYG